MLNMGRLGLSLALLFSCCLNAMFEERRQERPALSGSSSAFGSQEDLLAFNEEPPSPTREVNSFKSAPLSQPMDVILKPYTPAASIVPHSRFAESEGLATDIRIYVCLSPKEPSCPFQPLNNYDDAIDFKPFSIPADTPFMVKTTWMQDQSTHEHFALYLLLSEGKVQAFENALKNASEEILTPDVLKNVLTNIQNKAEDDDTFKSLESLLFPLA